MKDFDLKYVERLKFSRIVVVLFEVFVELKEFRFHGNGFTKPI